VADKYNKLVSSVASIISNIEDPIYDEIKNEIEKKLKALYNKGKINLLDDFALQHTGLEIRVEKLLKDMGFNVFPGRAKNLEDFIIIPHRHFSIQLPLVVEVKSGKYQHVHRKHLRQLYCGTYVRL